MTKIKKSEETRTRILEAALAVFRERGFEHATMREIAKAAEVAVGRLTTISSRRTQL